MMKKILSLILTLVLIMTMSVTAFAENVSITKETDQKEIAGIANSFFMEKEDAFLSDGNLKIAEYYSTNDVKNIKNDSSFHLFEYEKQMRDDNYLNISDEKFEYTIRSVYKELHADRETGAADNKYRLNIKHRGSARYSACFVVWGFQRGLPLGTRLCVAKCSVLYALSALP